MLALLSLHQFADMRRFLLLGLISIRRRVQRLNRAEQDIMEIRGHRGGVRSYVPEEVALATTVNCWVEIRF